MQTVYKKYITTSVIVWAASFVLFTLVYVLILSPQKKQLNDARFRISQRQNEFDKATDAYTGVTKERLDKEISLLRSKTDNFVAMAEDSSKLVTYLGQVANELNVTGFSSKRQTDQSQATLPQCKVLGAEHIFVSFKGTFNQFARFLNAMERHKPVIFVDKFSIVRSATGNFENDVTMVLAVFICPQNSSNSTALLAKP